MGVTTPIAPGFIMLASGPPKLPVIDVSEEGIPARVPLELLRRVSGPFSQNIDCCPTSLASDLIELRRAIWEAFTRVDTEDTAAIEGRTDLLMALQTIAEDISDSDKITYDGSDVIIDLQDLGALSRHVSQMDAAADIHEKEFGNERTAQKLRHVRRHILSVSRQGWQLGSQGFEVTAEA